MPVSKKRKKKGKNVKHDPEKLLGVMDPNKESRLTIQDLINVVAYQEYVKDGTITPPEETIDISDLPGENWVEDDMNQQEETQDER